MRVSKERLRQEIQQLQARLEQRDAVAYADHLGVILVRQCREGILGLYEVGVAGLGTIVRHLGNLGGEIGKCK
jgi:hypothetical protein